MRGRLREPVFLAWSIFSVGLTAGIVAADGGVDSPLTVLFLLPVVFAALSYPLPSVAAIGALRGGFEERLAAELDEGLRAGRPLALVMFDLDGFKEINDTQGHAAGDEILVWTVKTIQDTVRPMTPSAGSAATSSWYSCRRVATPAA